MKSEMVAQIRKMIITNVASYFSWNLIVFLLLGRTNVKLCIFANIKMNILCKTLIINN